MKFISLTVIAILPIATADIALASDVSHVHFHQSAQGDFMDLHNTDSEPVVRQGLPERRISGSSR